MDIIAWIVLGLGAGLLNYWASWDGSLAAWPQHCSPICCSPVKITDAYLIAGQPVCHRKHRHLQGH
jgi:hypothetical protein